MNAKGKGSSKGGGSKIGRDAGNGQFKQTKPRGPRLQAQQRQGRDAGSGQFIPVSEARRRPETTTVGTSKRPKAEGRFRMPIIKIIKQPKPKDLRPRLGGPGLGDAPGQQRDRPRS